MFYAYTNTFYCYLLWKIFSAVKKYSVLMGRILAIPIGVMMLTLQIFVRFSSLVESIIWIIKESIITLFSPNKKISLLPKKFSEVLKELFGFFICPITSLFASVAMSSSMIVNPKVTCEQFIIACENRIKKKVLNEKK
jgi:hypothetical protein